MFENYILKKLISIYLNFTITPKEQVNEKKQEESKALFDEECLMVYKELQQARQQWISTRSKCKRET